MRYIDPHIHMVSRTTDDYQRMAQAGCVAITEPAFWAGFDRSSAQGFHDYFRQLTEYEPQRAAIGRVLENGLGKRVDRDRLRYASSSGKYQNLFAD